jgi:hypothetical protein
MRMQRRCVDGLTRVGKGEAPGLAGKSLSGWSFEMEIFQDLRYMYFPQTPEFAARLIPPPHAAFARLIPKHFASCSDAG